MTMTVMIMIWMIWYNEGSALLGTMPYEYLQIDIHTAFFTKKSEKRLEKQGEMG